MTFLFTDIEGSTGHLHVLGADAYALALAEQRRVLREAFRAQGGVEVDTQGDAFFVAFPTAPGALAAAALAQKGLASGPIRVRMGVHTGTPTLMEEGYVGVDVHKGARIASAGHGGQVLLSAETRALLSDVDVMDLGEHRLKDFDLPVGIYQLGSEHFPPLKTISNTNLPRPARPIVGRYEEIGELTSLLSGDARLVTLTGSGGSGKSRLAIEVATRLISHFKAGVFWVPLAPLRDPSLVMRTIADTIGAKVGLAQHIGRRDLLLVLDNFEHIIGMAPELSSLVESCPKLRLLVTSREVLRVRGEVEYPLPPLADRDAVELFCALAGVEADPTVKELCRALDHLPLALELAAPRTKVLSPKQILERLAKRFDLLTGGRDADPRQRTLRATIGWSHDLLTRDEQLVFARLSVFRGGCSVESAEEIAGTQLEPIQSLVDKNLLRRSDERLVMLETIREFASEQLQHSGEADEIRKRHADHFVTLAETAEPYLRTNSKEWLARLEAEHDNLRGALDDLARRGDTESALRLLGAGWWFWSLRGHMEEGRARLDLFLRADMRRTRARAKALLGAADLAIDGQDPTAKARAEEAQALSDEIGDAWGSAYALYLIAMAHAIDNDLATAKRLFATSVAMFADIGDEYDTLQATRRLAWMHQELGDAEGARSIHEDNLRRARAAGIQEVVAATLATLSGFARAGGRHDEAVALLREATELHRGLDDLTGTLYDLHRIARLLAARGSAHETAELLAKADAMHEAMGFPREPWLTLSDEEALKTIAGALDASSFEAARRSGAALTLDEAVALGLRSLK